MSASSLPHEGRSHAFTIPTFDARYFRCQCGELWRMPTPPAPAQAHSETSKQAARSLDRNRYRQIVWDALRRAGPAIANPTPFGIVGGATDEELSEITRLSPNTARPRRIELVRDNLVVDSGFTRKTKANRAATVWVSVS